MLLFLCEVVEAQAVDLPGPETAEASNGRRSIGEQVQLHGRMRSDNDDTAADALIDPAPWNAKLLGELGDGQPARHATRVRRRLQDPVASADSLDRVDQDLAAVPR